MDWMRRTRSPGGKEGGREGGSLVVLAMRLRLRVGVCGGGIRPAGRGSERPRPLPDHIRQDCGCGRARRAAGVVARLRVLAMRLREAEQPEGDQRAAYAGHWHALRTHGK
jgi:hypothetical protein